jgi:hypothetical protein
MYVYLMALLFSYMLICVYVYKQVAFREEKYMSPSDLSLFEVLAYFKKCNKENSDYCIALLERLKEEIDGGQARALVRAGAISALLDLLGNYALDRHALIYISENDQCVTIPYFYL